jgi:hypothetical protein
VELGHTSEVQTIGCGAANDFRIPTMKHDIRSFLAFTGSVGVGGLKPATFAEPAHALQAGIPHCGAKPR